MSALHAAFHLVDAQAVKPSSSRIMPLPRRVADEIVLVSALCHLIVADIAAPWSDVLYATDSSDAKGAIVSTTLLA